jgi:hypothetical protein
MVSMVSILLTMQKKYTLENDPVQAQITMREFQFFESIIEKFFFNTIIVIFYLFINVKVALFAAFSISAGNLSSISASLTSFSLHSMFTNAIMWN